MKRSIKEYFSWNAITSLVVIPLAIIHISNWIPFILNYIGFANSNVTYVFRNGMKIKTTGPFDVASIAVVCLKRDYGVCEPNTTVVDIGANIGTFSLMAEKDGANVYAYEPMRQTFKALENNVKLNNSKINIFDQGVANRKCSRKLFLNAGSVFSSMYGTGKCSTIRCITLKDVLANIKHCNVLKIDCEGGEYEIFYNTSSKTFSKIGEIRMEYHFVKGQNIDNLLSFLMIRGFKVTKKRDDDNNSGIIWLKNRN